MATKRPVPDPVIVAKWARRLEPIMAELALRRSAVGATERELGETIRSAFADGVQVGAIKTATGLSSSRIFQYKFQLRDQGQQKNNGRKAG